VQGIKSEPHAAALFYMSAGQCNYYLGQYEEALAHYDIAIRKVLKVVPGGDEPILGLIYYNRGLSNASLVRYQDAIVDFNAAKGTIEATKKAQVLFQLGATERKIANSNIPDRENRTP